MTKRAEGILMIGAGLALATFIVLLDGQALELVAGTEVSAKLEIRCPAGVPLSIVIHDPQGAREMGCRLAGESPPDEPPKPPDDGILRQSWLGPYTSSGVCSVPGGDDPSIACPEQVTRLRWALPPGEYRAMRLSFTWTLPETCTSRGGAAKCAGAWWVVAGNERMLGYLVSGQWHDKAGVWRWGWVKGQANKAKESVSRLPRRVPLRVVMTAHAAEQWTSLLVEGPNGQVYQAHIQPAAHLPATFTIKRGDEVFVDLGFTGFDNPDEGAGGAWSDVLMEAL